MFFIWITWKHQNINSQCWKEKKSQKQNLTNRLCYPFTYGYLYLLGLLLAVNESNPPVRKCIKLVWIVGVVREIRTVSITSIYI